MVKLEQNTFYSTFDNWAEAFDTFSQLFFQTPQNNMICLGMKPGLKNRCCIRSTYRNNEDYDR
jgi:hypothetical protein